MGRATRLSSVIKKPLAHVGGGFLALAMQALAQPTARMRHACVSQAIAQTAAYAKNSNAPVTTQEAVVESGIAIHGVGRPFAPQTDIACASLDIAQLMAFAKLIHRRVHQLIRRKTNLPTTVPLSWQVSLP